MLLCDNSDLDKEQDKCVCGLGQLHRYETVTSSRCQSLPMTRNINTTSSNKHLHIYIYTLLFQFLTQNNIRLTSPASNLTYITAISYYIVSQEESRPLLFIMITSTNVDQIFIIFHC